MGWADAAKLARCDYWRWRIEPYFKLLKSHGYQLEDWLQETGEAILRRVLVVSMAAVTVWHLMATLEKYDLNSINALISKVNFPVPLLKSG